MVAYTKIKDGDEPCNLGQHEAVAEAAALESMVLLKNANAFLALKKAAVKFIAVSGPRADEVRYDYYSGPAPYLITPLQGIQEKLGAGATVKYALDNTDGAAVNAARSSDIAVVVVGNRPWCGVDRNAPNIWHDSATVPRPLTSEG
jgi:beta-glucosidase